jgi:hypothetical protein
MNEKTEKSESRLLKLLKRIFFVVVCLVTLVALVISEENWRGKRAWAKYSAELKARGEELDYEKFVPPPVPDDENFAMTPFLACLFDYNPRFGEPGQNRYNDTNAFSRTTGYFQTRMNPSRPGSWTMTQFTDLPAIAQALTNAAGKKQLSPPNLDRVQAARLILQQLEQYKPVMDELEKASKLPQCRFEVKYSTQPPFNILLPHLAVFKGASIAFQQRALAELELGQTDHALSDVNMVFYLANAPKGEPFLISGLVQIAIREIGLQPVWEGLAEHKWSDSQLAILETKLAEVDLVSDWPAKLRAERVAMIRGLDYYRNVGFPTDLNSPDSGNVKIIPHFLAAGWISQSEVTISRMMQDYYLSCANATNRVFPAELIEKNESRMTAELTNGFPLYKYMARMLLPAHSKIVVKYAHGQASVDEALIACALERYRIANGRYPESLEQISALLPGGAPHDVVNGEPLKYRLREDGNFTLYSVGWNLKDDGGTVALTGGSTPTQDRDNGDWVWEYPKKNSAD